MWTSRRRGPPATSARPADYFFPFTPSLESVMSQHAPVLTRRGVLRAAAAVTVTGSLVACGKNDDQAADGVVSLEFWHGQVDTGKAAIDALINEFNRTHPAIRVNGGGGGVTADSM